MSTNNTLTAKANEGEGTDTLAQKLTKGN